MKEINKEEFKKEIEDYVKVLFRKTIKEADQQQLFQAVSYAVKDFIVDQWMATHKTYEEKDVKTVYYLSMEFLMGRALGNMIINLKGNKEIKEAVEELGLDLDVIEDQEPDAALGNCGLRILVLYVSNTEAFVSVRSTMNCLMLPTVSNERPATVKVRV